MASYAFFRACQSWRCQRCELLRFSRCSDPTTCWISYVERPWTIPLTGKTSVSLSYSIAGNAPVFDYRTSTNNTCLGAASLSLLLHQAGDNLSGQGAYAFYRWFSWQEAQPLALGDHTLTVPLSVDKWVSVYRSTPEAIAAGFASALANMGSIGLGLGGGCFAAHGVTVTSGSARFVITGFSVQ